MTAVSATFRVRVKLMAVEENKNLHVHGCFGEVHPPDATGRLFCSSCEKEVPMSDTVTPYANTEDYRRDVAILIRRIDALEEDIATWEDRT